MEIIKEWNTGKVENRWLRQINLSLFKLSNSFFPFRSTKLVKVTNSISKQETNQEQSGKYSKSCLLSYPYLLSAYVIKVCDNSTDANLKGLMRYCFCFFLFNKNLVDVTALTSNGLSNKWAQKPTGDQVLHTILSLTTCRYRNVSTSFLLISAKISVTSPVRWFCTWELP